MTRKGRIEFCIIDDEHIVYAIDQEKIVDLDFELSKGDAVEFEVDAMTEELTSIIKKL